MSNFKVGDVLKSGKDEVTIICTNYTGSYPILGLYTFKDGRQATRSFTQEGRFQQDAVSDEDIKKTCTMWFWISGGTPRACINKPTNHEYYNGLHQHTWEE